MVDSLNIIRFETFSIDHACSAEEKGQVSSHW